MEPEQRAAVSGIASQTIDVMKSTPVVLSLVVFNVLFMAMVTYLSISTGDRWERIMQASLDRCAATSK